MILLKKQPMPGSPTQDMPENLLRELNRADRLLRDAGEKVRKDPRLSDLLHRYRETIGETTRAMEAWGVAEECSACAREGSGSCCFQGVEEWYDGTLLFINLLMGCQIPRSREFDGRCLFVGSNGCRLKARYAFCVNYLCPRLKDRMGEKGTAELLAAAGRELGAGWEMERALSQRLKLWGTKRAR